MAAARRTSAAGSRRNANRPCRCRGLVDVGQGQGGGRPDGRLVAVVGPLQDRLDLPLRQVGWNSRAVSTATWMRHVVVGQQRQGRGGVVPEALAQGLDLRAVPVDGERAPATPCGTAADEPGT